MRRGILSYRIHKSRKNLGRGLLPVLVFFFLAPFTLMAGSFQEPYSEVTVARGDSLIVICERYLENPGQWRKIAKINELKNPHLLYPGQTLLFPVALLKGEPSEGTVRFLRGDAEIREKEGHGWRKLLLNDRLQEGSTVRTGKASAVEVEFESGDSWAQRSDTVLGITNARKKGSFFFHHLFLETGKAITNIKKATGRESRFMIDTPSAVCAARGTEFRTSVDASEVTRLEVLEGMIDVEAASQSVTIAEGEGTLVKKGKAPQTPKKLLPPPQISEKQMIYKKMPLELAFRKIEGALSYRVVIARNREIRDVLSEQLFRPDALFSMVQLEDGTYYLQTQSIDDEGLEGLSSSPVEVVVRVNPVPPYIQFPADEGEYRETAVPCSWLSVKDAAAYHVQIAEDREFRAIVQDRSDIYNTAYKADTLDYRSYYFRVSSIAGDRYEGEWSDTIRFTVIPPPPVPQIDKPDIEGQEISIHWPNLGAGYTYRFQMSGDEKFSSVLVDDHIDKAGITLQKPDKAGVYYVRTSSIDSKGYEGSFSEPQSFEIKRGLFLEFLGITGVLGLLFLLL
ncbi:MAG: FecR domain-containing protein [Thermodesulfovibrionales bacterium]|nr:FecR domain-containing protein [Thermodesulfovibrionales bacterium]